MSGEIQGCGRLNPWNYEMNKKTTTAAVIVSALAAIGLVAGALAVLSCLNYSVPLSFLGGMTMPGGGALAVFSGVTFLAGLAWIVEKALDARRGYHVRHGQGLEVQLGHPDNRIPPFQSPNGSRRNSVHEQQPPSGSGENSENSIPQDPPIRSDQSSENSISQDPPPPPPPQDSRRNGHLTSPTGTQENNGPPLAQLSEEEQRIELTGLVGATILGQINSQPAEIPVNRTTASPIQGEFPPPIQQPANVSAPENGEGTQEAQLFAPFEQFKEARASLFAQQQPEVGAVQRYTLLDQLNERLKVELTYNETILLAKKRQFDNQRDAFIRKIQESFAGLLKGEVEVAENGTSETLRGEFTCPAHAFSAVLFARSKLIEFNEVIDEHNLTAQEREKIERIEIENVLPWNEFAAEKREWENLLGLENSPVLGTQELERLETIAQNLAPQYLKEKLQEAVQKIAEKPVLDVDHASQALQALYTKLDLGNAPQPIYYPEKFKQDLQEGVLAFFRYETENDPTPPLTVDHLGQIKQYVEQQAAAFQAAYSIDLELEIQHELNELNNWWSQVAVLKSPRLNVDQKIDLLSTLATSLPDAAGEIWRKYPVIKDCMGEQFSRQLAFSYFSNHEFRYPLSEEDQERRVTIESAYEVFAQKLGCNREQLRLPEIIMDCEDDEAQAQEVALQERVDQERDDEARAQEVALRERVDQEWEDEELARQLSQQ